MDYERPSPCPSRKQRRETPRVPFPARDCCWLPWLCFPLSPQQWQWEALSWLPSTSPGMRVGAGMPQTSSSGWADRKALSPRARTPGLRPAGRRIAIWQLQGFPVASLHLFLQASGSRERRQAGRRGRGGDGGQNPFVWWPSHRHALAGPGENKRGMSASKRQEMKQHRGREIYWDWAGAFLS